MISKRSLLTCAVLTVTLTGTALCTSTFANQNPASETLPAVSGSVSDLNKVIYDKNGISIRLVDILVREKGVILEFTNETDEILSLAPVDIYTGETDEETDEKTDTDDTNNTDNSVEKTVVSAGESEEFQVPLKNGSGSVLIITGDTPHEFKFVAARDMKDPVKVYETKIDVLTSESESLASENISLSESLDSKTQEAEKLASDLDGMMQQAEVLTESLEAKTKEVEALTESLEAKTEEADALSESLEVSTKEAGELRGSLDEKTQEAEELGKSLEEKTKEAEELGISLEEKTKEAEELGATLEEKTKEAEELGAALEEKTKEAEDLGGSLQEKTLEAENLSSSLEEKTKEAEDLTVSLEEKTKEAENLGAYLESKTAEADELGTSLEVKTAEYESISSEKSELEGELAARDETISGLEDMISQVEAENEGLRLVIDPGMMDESVLTSELLSNEGIEYFDWAAVRAIQIALNKEGFDCGKVDGVWGPHTEAGILAYEKDAGLTENGIITEELVRSLMDRGILEGSILNADDTSLYMSWRRYDLLCSGADNLVGTRLKISGKVLQAVSPSEGHPGYMRLAINNDNSQVVFVTMQDGASDFDIKEYDEVDVYGRTIGHYTCTGKTGEETELPWMMADRVTAE